MDRRSEERVAAMAALARLQGELARDALGFPAEVEAAWEQATAAMREVRRWP